MELNIYLLKGKIASSYHWTRDCPLEPELVRHVRRAFFAVAQTAGAA